MKKEIVLSAEIAEEIKREVSRVVRGANEIEVVDKIAMGFATDYLGKIKNAQKLVLEKKESITKPLNEALANARAFFAPFETELRTAEGIVKGKMVKFNLEEEKKVKEEQDKLAQRVDKGTMKFETASKKMEKIEEGKVGDKVESESGKAIFRTRRMVEITDRSLIPDEYWVVDEVKVRKDALAGKEIPGVKVVEIKEVAGSGK